MLFSWFIIIKKIFIKQKICEEIQILVRIILFTLKSVLNYSYSPLFSFPNRIARHLKVDVLPISIISTISCVMFCPSTSDLRFHLKYDYDDNISNKMFLRKIPVLGFKYFPKVFSCGRDQNRSRWSLSNGVFTFSKGPFLLVKKPKN